MLKHGILGLLNYGDMTGYEIKMVFEDSLSHFWQAQTSQIYRELQALEKNGWIESTHVKQDGKPDKNVLSITKDGRKELLKWLEDDSKNDPIRSPMLMKVFFRGECSLDENIEYFKDLAQKESVFPDNGEIVKDKSNEYVNNIDDPLKALYWKFTIDFGVMYSKMVREWCEKCVNELEVIKNEGSIN